MNISYKEFIEKLDEPIKSAVLNLDSSGLEIRQIANEISGMPLAGMSAKGTKNWDKTIFQKILKELAIIICKNDKESELSKQLYKETDLSTQVIIVAASHYIANKLGFAVALCTPFVILAFATILKAGHNVFCKEFQQ